MIPLVELPEIVEHYAPYFEGVFSEEAFIEFKRYISGLIVSENKTVDGINRLFVMESRNQSSLNRLLTESPYSLEGINDARQKVLESVPKTRLKPRGVLSIDDTLLTHYGEHFEKIAKLWDHVTESYVWAHNLVTLHYSDDETDYPLRFQLWEPLEVEKLEEGLREAKVPIRADKESLKTSNPVKWRSYLQGVWRRRQAKYPEIRDLYENKLTIAQNLLQEWMNQHPDQEWPVTFDTWYTQADFCRFIDETLHLPYVGTLAEGDKVNLKTGQTALGEFAKHLKAEDEIARKEGSKPVFQPITVKYKGEQQHYYSYCRTHHIHNFGKQRLVINHNKADLSDTPTFYISNRLVWQAPGITRIRRHRWPVEVYHQEGKAEGLDQYQLRDFCAIQRHVAFVAVVYSLLRAAQYDQVLRVQLQCELKIALEGNPAAWRRASQAQSLWSLALFISAGLAQGHSLQTILAPMIQSICRV